MRRLWYNKKGQYSLEMAALLSLAVVGVFFMMNYLTACIKGRYAEDTEAFLGGNYQP